MKINNIDIAVRQFAEFINKSWETAIPLLLERNYTTNESSIADWLQSNWEIMVERKILKINEYLEVYGEGADYNGSSSRMTDPYSLPNYRITVNSISNDKIFDLLNEEYINANSLTFIELVSFKNDFYKKEPEFNFILIEDINDVKRVISLDQVSFGLQEI